MDLPLPVLSVLLFVFVCGYFVWLFLESALFSITCLSQHLSTRRRLGAVLGGGTGLSKHSTLLFISDGAVISEKGGFVSQPETRLLSESSPLIFTVCL